MNNNKDMFNKYYSRMAKEGILKSLIFSLLIGFAASIIPSFIAWLVNYNGVWISLITVVIVTAALTPIIYRLFFRPTVEDIAKRIDNLGLKQRLTTMMELEKDDSYIATLQREDAKANLMKFNKERLEYSFSLKPFVLLGVFALLSLAMMLISALTVEPRMQWTANAEPQNEVEERLPDPEYDYVIINYIATPGGYIYGDIYQVVIKGQDALPVVAIPFEGYAFVDWLDGLESPDRLDREVTEDTFPVAQFQPSGDGDNNSDNENEPSERPQPSEDGEEDVFDPNKIIDGGIDYTETEIFKEYMEKLAERLANGEPLPSELLDLIDKYFKSIEEIGS